MKDLMKEATDILGYKYSYKHEAKLHKGKINVILSDEEAFTIQMALRIAYRYRYLFELQEELEKSREELEIVIREKNDYIPPLDDFIQNERKRIEYIESRILDLKSSLAEVKGGKNEKRS